MCHTENRKGICRAGILHKLNSLWNCKKWHNCSLSCLSIDICVNIWIEIVLLTGNMHSELLNFQKSDDHHFHEFLSEIETEYLLAPFHVLFRWPTSRKSLCNFKVKFQIEIFLNENCLTTLFSNTGFFTT